MTRRFRGGIIVALILALAACAGPGKRLRSGPDEAIALAFEDEEMPDVFTREALARRDRPKGTQGLWASVPGLRRPERAEVVNLETGASVTVALFSGGGPKGEIRISNAAAELIGIGQTPARVKVTAVRRQPVIVAP